MSKITFIAIAGASAAIGAATTAAILTSTAKKQPSINTIPVGPTPAVTFPQSQSPTRTAPISSSPILKGEPIIPIHPPVDPRGIFGPTYQFKGLVLDERDAGSLTLSYNRRTRNPDWVVEHITPTSLSINHGDRRGSVFTEDQAIPAKFRAKLSDYLRSGYDRGHQVPAADAKWSQEAMDATFSLSNMCPQVGAGFNRDYWSHLEDFCRRLTSRYPSVRIVTGPLYLPKRDPTDGKWKTTYEVIGNPPNVAVPTHFYKVIFAEDNNLRGDVAVGAFVLPNAPIDNNVPLTNFEVKLEAVEIAAGFDFAPALTPEKRRSLCRETNCSIMVKNFSDRAKSAALPAPGSTPQPPRR